MIYKTEKVSSDFSTACRQITSNTQCKAQTLESRVSYPKYGSVYKNIQKPETIDQERKKEENNDNGRKMRRVAIKNKSIPSLCSIF